MTDISQALSVKFPNLTRNGESVCGTTKAEGEKHKKQWHKRWDALNPQNYSLKNSSAAFTKTKEERDWVNMQHRLDRQVSRICYKDIGEDIGLNKEARKAGRPVARPEHEGPPFWDMMFRIPA
jgi:hypothetical protein